MVIHEKCKKIFPISSNNPLVDILTPINTRNTTYIRSNTVPIYFYRYIGSKNTIEQYLDMLKQLDKNLKSSPFKFLKITKGLKKAFSNEEIEYAKSIWMQYCSIKNNNYIELYNLKWETGICNKTLNWTIKKSFERIVNLFKCNEKNINESILKNFAVLIILWTNQYLKCLFEDETYNKEIPKLIYYGPIKRNETYFLIYISMLGCDVLYINPKEDIGFSKTDPECTYSKLIQYTNKFDIMNFPESSKPEKVTDQKEDENTTFNLNNSKSCIKDSLKCETSRNFENSHLEKSYEELGELSSSVVMINIYNKDLILEGGGSGVVIDENGLIVTNYHVIKNAPVLGILFEDNDKEIIQYKVLQINPECDLALLRINCKTKPIPIKRDSNLKRGQEIVAIGSPLGFMNTVSTGIISGFRRIQNINFIQITAPISPGSSGGALIDKYGNLIGITCAGYTEGQNINLAVPIAMLPNLSTDKF